ncbi:MAG TPA: VOC family protein [Clostridiaceae bacterium]
MNLSSSIYKITPFLMFVGPNKGKAEEAMNFYISLFNNSSVLQIERYGPGEAEPEGTVKHSTFSLDAQEFMALDSSAEHAFTFSEAISFFVDCDTQDEVDMLWEELSQGGEKGQCGWIKDKYGVSWQIVPTILGELLGDPDPVKAQRAMGAMLKMSKLNIEELKKVHREG